MMSKIKSMAAALGLGALSARPEPELPCRRGDIWRDDMGRERLVVHVSARVVVWCRPGFGSRQTTCSMRAWTRRIVQAVA